MSGSLRSSLLILVLSTLDNALLLAAMDSVPKTNFSVAVNTSRNFACMTPQPRAYNLRDLTQSLYQNTGESAIQPAYIVLKRCDGHAGCCSSPEMSCIPMKSEIYYEEVEIKVWSLNNNTRKQWIRVQQHGQCACEITTTGDRFELEHQQPNVTLV